jgi:hypothetical protein
VWHKFKRIVIHGLPTLRRDGELAEYFPQNHGGARFSRNCAPPCIRREKTSPCRNENYAAFSLPQDSLVQLMFGAARFREPASSASRSLGFCAAPRGGHSSHRLDNRCKCFNQRRILDAARWLVSMRLKRLQRRGFSQATACLRRRLAFGLPQRA